MEIRTAQEVTSKALNKIFLLCLYHTNACPHMRTYKRKLGVMTRLYLQFKGIVCVTNPTLFKMSSSFLWPLLLTQKKKKTYCEHGSKTFQAVTGTAVNLRKVQGINLILSSAHIGTLILIGTQYGTSLCV